VLKEADEKGLKGKEKGTFVNSKVENFKLKRTEQRVSDV
jgi:hypothetical protein